MRVLFWHSDKPRERLLAEAFIEGVRSHGDVGEMRSLSPDAPADPSFDVACMCGVKSVELFRRHTRAGLQVVYLDKGYCRHKSTSATRIWEYWRVSAGGHQPTRYLMSVKRPGDRLAQLGLRIEPWRDEGEQIVFAGSSAKYHQFYGLSGPTSFAQKICRKLHALTGRPIVYRPKPSWHDAEPIEGTIYSEHPEMIGDVLRGAHALVTHGSNSCFEAVLAGVPCVIIGDAVAKPISSTKIEDIEAPMFVSDKVRRQWLANLSYCQWTMPEMASGQAWSIIRQQIYA